MLLSRGEHPPNPPRLLSTWPSSPPPLCPAPGPVPSAPLVATGRYHSYVKLVAASPVPSQSLWVAPSSSWQKPTFASATLVPALGRSLVAPKDRIPANCCAVRISNPNLKPLPHRNPTPMNFNLPLTRPSVLQGSAAAHADRPAQRGEREAVGPDVEVALHG